MGARPWIHLCATVPSLKVMRCCAGSQWSWSHITLRLGHTNPRRKSQDETSRSAHHGLQTVYQAQRSVGQNIVTIVESTVEHRTDELYHLKVDNTNFHDFYHVTTIKLEGILDVIGNPIPTFPIAVHCNNFDFLNCSFTN